jgi:hypothetical protein
MPDTSHPYVLWDTSQPKAAPVTVTQCDGYVVVSRWTKARGTSPYSYDHFTTLNEAADHYTALEDGEVSHFAEVGIFPALNGMPIDKPLDPITLTRLVRETRQA